MSLLDTFNNAIGNANPTPSLEPDDLSPVDVANVFQPLISISDGFFALSNYEKWDSSNFSKLFNYYFVIYSADDPGNPIATFQFPLNPTNIQIDVVPASSIEVTMKGIVENHNGAPLRRVSIHGTSGVAPNEPVLTPSTSEPSSAAESLFKNTFAQAVRVANQAKGLADTASAIFGGPSGSKPIINMSNTDLKGKTGYDMIHTLMSFLDGYLSAKKLRKNAKMRLSFIMAKDQIVYDCSLGPHRYRKNPGTLEYEYDIELTAFRRRKFADSTKETPNKNSTTTPQDLNKLAQIMKGLTQAQLLVASSIAIMSGIRADINDSFLEPVRSFILLGNDLVGAAHSISEFPNSVVNECKAAVVGLMSVLHGTAKLAAIEDYLINTHGIYGPVTADTSSTAAGGGPIVGEVKRYGETSRSDSTNPATDASPINQIFQNPALYPDVFQNFPVNSMALTPQMQQSINTEIARVQALTYQNLQAMRDTVSSYAVSISAGLGGANATYNRINGLAAPRISYHTTTTDDIVLLSQLNDIVQGMDSFISAFNDGTTDQTNDYYKFYADYARSNSITFNDSASKYYVPFPYDASLESLAVQYLNNADRWIEIAALNGLQSPYIDETGYTIPLVGSGSGNQFTVASAAGLYIGQTISIASTFQAPTARHITSIKVESSIEAIITVDGDPTLAIYLIADGAYVTAFAPNTVNSLQMIAIPSDSAVTVPANLQITPTPADLDTITLVALVDLALDSTGDLIFSSSGDLVLSTGMANLVQAAKIKLLTPAGSIVSDPSFGNPLTAGLSLGDVTAKSVLPLLSQMFASDPRFGAILAGSIAISGPSADIKLLVGVKGTNLNLPLVADVPL